MNYIACRNLKRCSDTLYINKDIVKYANQLISLVEIWLHDRGCDDIELITKIRKVLPRFHNDNLHYNESNSGLFQVIISLDSNKTQFIVTFNYTVIGDLTYKEMKDENQN